MLAGVRRGRKGCEINAWRQVSEVPRFFQHPSSDLAFGSATFSHTGRREELAQPAIVRQFKIMTCDAIKTLFYPFETGDVDIPGGQARPCSLALSRVLFCLRVSRGNWTWFKAFVHIFSH